MVDSTIRRTRGDTIPEYFLLELTDYAGAPMDLGDLTSIVMTVHSIENPPDATGVLASLTGTVVTVGENFVRFDGTWDALPVGKHYYDIEVTFTDLSLWTPVKGVCLVTQDITK